MFMENSFSRTWWERKTWWNSYSICYSPSFCKTG